MAADDRSGRRAWAAWHPLVFGAWPVLHLYARNTAETPLGDALPVLGWTLAAVAALQLAVTLLARDVRRGALVTSVLVVGCLTYGHVRDPLGDPGWLLPLWCLLLALLAAAAARTRRVLDELTTIAAGVAAVLVAFPLVGIATAVRPAVAGPPAGPGHAELEARVGPWSVDGPPRDIVYLVFDRYGSQRGLRDRFGVDNGPFVADLRRRGFFVADDAVANYGRTAHSLASSLNLRHLDGLARAYGQDFSSYLPLYGLLRHHAVGKLLRARGYEYVHIGAWWDPTQESPQADVNLTYEPHTDFELEFWYTTLLSEATRDRREKTADERRRVPYEGAQAQLRQVREAVARPGPTFVFAHILLPHQPFVFDRHGGYVSLERDRRRGHDRGYVDQLAYTNRQLQSLLDDLLAVAPSRRPVILLQADEGPHPVRLLADEDAFNWEEATQAELHEKFRILSAYYLPGVDDPGLYRSMTPVNSWRVVFNAYFGADLPLLADRSWVYRDRLHPWALTEVTHRLRGRGAER